MWHQRTASPLTRQAARERILNSPTAPGPSSSTPFTDFHETLLARVSRSSASSQPWGRQGQSEAASRSCSPSPPPPPPPRLPKAHHENVNADPKYLRTADMAYKRRSGIGLVYDWDAQNRMNNELTRQARAKVHTTLLMAAVEKHIEVREKNQKVFHLWLQDKYREQTDFRALNKTLGKLQAVKDHIRFQEHPYEEAFKEEQWRSNFGVPSERSSFAAKQLKITRKHF